MTYYYRTTDGEHTQQVAFFDGLVGMHKENKISNHLIARTVVQDSIGRTVATYTFNKSKKYRFDADPDYESVTQAGYRMYAAPWLDKEIMGYPTRAFFIRELAAFAPTYVYWVSDHADFPHKHPHNFRYPGLPGFVMGFSWSAKRTFELTTLQPSVDPFLFTAEESEPMPEQVRLVQKGFTRVFMPLFGNRIVQTASNLYKLFGG